jgi:acyl-CoA synthetase (AMP-forming)/AMP-acid ligase II
MMMVHHGIRGRSVLKSAIPEQYIILRSLLFASEFWPQPDPSVEIEGILGKHPAVAAAAVVAKPDDKWGETPCAFVELKPGQTATIDEIIAWCKGKLASYKCPRTVIFATIPKTSTGKIQKFKLREMAKAV